MHSRFTGCKPTHQACSDHVQTAAPKGSPLSLCFLPLLSTLSVQLGLCHTHQLVTPLQRNPGRPFVLSERGRLEGIVLPRLFEQGGLMRGVSSAVPVPCSAVRGRLQPAQEKLPFVVARCPCRYLTEAEQKLPRPVTPHTNERIWESVYLVTISVASLFLTFKLINLNEVLKEQEISSQMRKYKTRSPILFLFFSNTFHGFSRVTEKWLCFESKLLWKMTGRNFCPLQRKN